MPTTKTNFTKRWLTVLDVVEEYGFSDTKQYQLRKDKKIPFSKIQGSIRYDRILIDQWLEDNAVNVIA
jgi:predicted DNA-binding transcriptional regulator AlpA